MAPDLTLVGGLIFAALAITGLLHAWAEKVFPVRGLAFAIFSGTLLWQSWEMRGRQLGVEDVPEAIMRLINLAMQ